MGLDSEPLTSLANPVPAALWSIQAGGVALSEARNFQLSVDAVAAGDAVGDSYSNFSRPWRWNDASGVSRAVAVLQTAMIGRCPRRWPSGSPSARGQAARRRRRRRRGRLGGGADAAAGEGIRRVFQGVSIGLGRFAMLAMATLALNADLEKGVLNDLLSKGLEIGFEAPMAAREPRFEAPVANAETFGSAAERKSAESELLVGDISQLVDVPPS